MYVQVTHLIVDGTDIGSLAALNNIQLDPRDTVNVSVQM